MADHPNNNDAPKYDAGKVDLSQLPLDVLSGLAKAYEYGIFKYYEYSWRKGFKTNKMIAAALRHINEWQWRGQDFDAEAREKGFLVH